MLRQRLTVIPAVFAVCASLALSTTPSEAKTQDVQAPRAPEVQAPRKLTVDGSQAHGPHASRALKPEITVAP